MLGVVFVAHLGILWHFAVDVPFSDEWAVFAPERPPLDGPLSWDFVFGRHNEHRIAFARIETWLLYRLDGWNLVTQQLLNFVGYGLGVAGLVWACVRRVPELSPWAHMGGALFMLSSLGWENFSWGFQSSSYEAVFAFLLAVWLLGGDRPTALRLGAGVIAGVCAICAQAAGVAATAILGLTWALWKTSLLRRATEAAGRRRAGIELLGVLGVLGLVIALWARGFSPVEGQHPEAVWPWSALFWRYYVNTVSLGFGIRSRSVVLGLLCLALVVAPLVGLVWARRPLPARDWTLVAWGTGLLGVLAAVTLGRAGLDPELRLAKSSRYAVFAQPLVVIALAAWAAWFREGTPRALAWVHGWVDRGPAPGTNRVRCLALALVWGVACAGHLDDWRPKPYREAHALRMRALQTLRRHRAGSLRSELAPGDLSAHLAEARRLGVRFTR